MTNTSKETTFSPKTDKVMLSTHNAQTMFPSTVTTDNRQEQFLIEAHPRHNLVMPTLFARSYLIGVRKGYQLATSFGRKLSQEDQKMKR